MKVKRQNLLQTSVKTMAVFLAIALFLTAFPLLTQAAGKESSIGKAKINLEYTSTVYTGKPKLPAVTVKYGKKTLKKNKDYIVTYRNNKKVGTATVLIKGKGKYKGAAKKTFRILPQSTSITSLSEAPASFVVQWKVQKKQTTGYQIEYSRNKEFKSGSRVVTVLSNTVSSRKVSDLLPETVYYVRIRTYREEGFRNYFSTWSEAKQVKTEAQSEADPDAILTKRNADIALQILKDRLKTDGKGNYMLSPFSLYEDLAMAANGAGGDTLAELEAYLGGDIGKINELLVAFNKLLTQNVQAANSIWVNEEYGEMIPQFQQMIQEFYDAQVEAVPYNPETVDRINAWVKEHTHGMIPKLLDELSDEEVMHLLNAVVFEAEWEHPYKLKDIYEKEKFTRADGKKETCTMLHSEENEYVEIKDDQGETIAYGFLKPYADGQTAFLGILPNEGKTPEDVLAVLDGETYASLYQGRQKYTKGRLYAEIPEFSLDDTIKLNPYLQNGGIRKSFTDDADFSGMMKEFPLLHIDSVMQKTHIEVDRHGTKAAAVTDIIMECSSSIDPERQDLHLILNRPFLYAIVDYESGVPFFMGVQNSIK